MRRAAFAVAAIAALVTVALAPQGAGQATRKPQLRLMDADVVMVSATGFYPREHVRLVVRADGVVTRTATVGTGGGFRMRVPGISTSACTGFSITATGDHGSKATFKRAPGRCALP